MALIRSCADLRNNYNKISIICHETNEPIYITRNGTNDLVVLSDAAYENLTKDFIETTEERVDRLLAEKFDEHYAYFEEFQKYFWKKIEQAIKEVDEGKCRTMEEFCAETEAKSQII
jgi:PHD/YefM family antitoxin component YafN of YafNO toxin-antitoxin module